jgi:flagellar biosynthesis protein FlhF
MRLRTYRARTIGDALAQVKKDMGKDAVILHTRSFKLGGWFGFGGKAVVEITASDTVNIPPRPGHPDRVSATPGQRESVSRPSPVHAPSVDNFRDSEPAAAPSAIRAYASASSPATLLHHARRAASSPPPSSEPAETAAPLARPPAAPPMPPPARIPASPALDEEIAVIKRMVGQVLQTTRHAALRAGNSPGHAVASAGMPETLAAHYLKLLESEVAAELADEVIGQVRDELTAAELADSDIVHQTVLRHLAAIIPGDGDVPRPGRPADGRPLIIALVGPTGVGKTTTVAKLAAAYKLRHGKRVGLITTDTYRIAAVDQLRTYAEIIGLPLKVAMSPADIPAICEALNDCDVILIDTAGRSQRDAGRLEELRQFIDAARPHQTHLVLSSAASQSVLVEAAQRFAHVSPDRIIFTKVDEAVNFGVLVTVAHKVALKLSYITTGQEVPDHIEVGRPERIARLLLDGREIR